MHSAGRLRLQGLHGQRLCALPALSACSRRPAAGASSLCGPCTCAQQKPVEELRRIRFRKGLVSFKERHLQRTRQVVLPTIEAAAEVEQQVAWAAGAKLRRALDFRLWTARGKGLVLLNLLVRAPAGLPPCMASALSLSAWAGQHHLQHSFLPQNLHLIKQSCI